MTTLLAGNSASFTLGTLQSLNISTGGTGTLSFTSSSEIAQPSFTASVANGDFGPYNVSMAVVMTMTSGSADYTVVGGADVTAEVNPLTGGISYLVGDQSGLPAVATLRNARGLRRWRAVQGSASYQPIRLAVHGDSITMGSYSDDSSPTPSDTVSDAAGFCGRLRQLYATMFGTTPAGFIPGNDTRVTASGGSVTISVGPALTTQGSVLMGTRSIGAGNTLSFALPVCTGYSILSMDSNAGGAGNTGTFSYATDGGGATTTTVDNTASDNPKRVSVTGLGSTTHTVLITGVSGSCYIMGIEYYGANGVIVSRFGLSGGASNDKLGNGATLNLNAAGQSRIINHSFNFYGAQLDIIALGHNDYRRQNDATYPVTPTQFAANVQAMITPILARGGCVLLVGEPKSNVTGPLTGAEIYPIESYWSALDTLSSSQDNVAVLQINRSWGTFQNGVDLGLQSAPGGVHPLKKGYADIAFMLFNALTGPAVSA